MMLLLIGIRPSLWRHHHRHHHPQHQHRHRDGPPALLAAQRLLAPENDQNRLRSPQNRLRYLRRNLRGVNVWLPTWPLISDDRASASVSKAQHRCRRPKGSKPPRCQGFGSRQAQGGVVDGPFSAKLTLSAEEAKLLGRRVNLTVNWPAVPTIQTK